MLRILLILLASLCPGCTLSSRAPSDWCHWAQRRGGLLHDQRQQRAAGALAQLSAGLISDPLTIHVLDCPTPTAYAWPGGAIFVTRGLVDLLSCDDELTAAIAHEVGHLLDGGRLRTVMTLGGYPQTDPDAEIRADELACRLLQARGMAAEQLMRALQKVQASQHLSPAGRVRLQSRIARLRAGSLASR